MHQTEKQPLQSLAAWFPVEAGLDVIGIDQSEGMLKVARARFPDADYIRMPLHEMRFGAVFDGVLCMDAMEHIFPEDYPRILCAFRQALKPGGVLYFTADREENPDFDLDLYFKKGQGAGYPVLYGEVFDPEAFEQAMADVHAPDEVTDRAVYHDYPPLAIIRAWIDRAGLDITAEGEGSGFHHFLARKPAAS